MNIMKDCLLLNMQVGVWLGYRLDKEMTHKVTTDADAAPDAARVNKHLIAKEHLSEIITAGSTVRNHFYGKTLPWKDNGDRILTRKISQEFIVEHSELKDKFDSAVEDFLDRRYLIAQEQAQFRMGDMFKADDYPSAGELRRKFYVNLDIDGIGAAHDIRLNNSDDIFQSRVTRAVSDLWTKLAEPLARFADTMSDPDKRLHDSTIVNLRAICEMLPALNFTDDPALEHIRTEIEENLTRFEPSDLRKNKEVRAAVGEQAREIMVSMEGFMRALGKIEEDA